MSENVYMFILTAIKNIYTFRNLINVSETIESRYKEYLTASDFVLTDPYVEVFVCAINPGQAGRVV